MVLWRGPILKVRTTCSCAWGALLWDGFAANVGDLSLLCLSMRRILTLLALATTSLCANGLRASPRTQPAKLEAPAQAGRAILSPVWPVSSMKVLPTTALRTAAVMGGSSLAASAFASASTNTYALWNFDGASMAVAPLVTMAAMAALVAGGRVSFGTEMHPITAKARNLEPPPGLSFQVLGLGGALVASAALETGWTPLQIAASPLELSHCALPFVLWQIDTRLLKWLNPHVEWSTDATSLVPNYQAEYGSLVSAAIALLGVFTFEVYVQQLLAAPLTQAGWPLCASAALIALNAGLLNHALANGLLNGILCMEFYWTVSLMFALSDSVLPVGM